jgi:hypothetical protein
MKRANPEVKRQSRRFAGEPVLSSEQSERIEGPIRRFAGAQSGGIAGSAVNEALSQSRKPAFSGTPEGWWRPVGRPVVSQGRQPLGRRMTDPATNPRPGGIKENSTSLSGALPHHNADSKGRPHFRGQDTHLGLPAQSSSRRWALDLPDCEKNRATWSWSTTPRGVFLMPLIIARCHSTRWLSLECGISNLSPENQNPSPCPPGGVRPSALSADITGYLYHRDE